MHHYCHNNVLTCLLNVTCRILQILGLRLFFCNELKTRNKGYNWYIFMTFMAFYGRISNKKLVCMAFKTLTLFMTVNVCFYSCKFMAFTAVNIG